ncbi:MAG: type II toxin-antitoxin system VapC family toxin [Ignavibacteria bacterium]|nr:type II toxin-antitoxin system VapC family toxin [Ignavibacteria bacterium]
MIVLDTHIWVWWVQNSPRLTKRQIEILKANESSGLGISVISCWEIAKSIELKRLELPLPIEQWLEQALLYPGIQLLNITPQIAIESTRLPATFHRDPADQMIVATTRIFDCELLTADSKILNYPFVKLAL